MTDNEVYESNLQHFKISKRYGDKTQCNCPAHNDKQASLTITKGRKCTLFHCHAGCTLENILSAAGLEKKILFTTQSHSVVTGEPMLKAGRNAGLKQFITTFLVTDNMPLPKSD